MIEARLYLDAGPQSNLVRSYVLVTGRFPGTPPASWVDLPESGPSPLHKVPSLPSA